MEEEVEQEGYPDGSEEEYEDDEDLDGSEDLEDDSSYDGDEPDSGSDDEDHQDGEEKPNPGGNKQAKAITKEVSALFTDDEVEVLRRMNDPLDELFDPVRANIAISTRVAQRQAESSAANEAIIAEARREDPATFTRLEPKVRQYIKQLDPSIQGTQHGMNVALASAMLDEAREAGVSLTSLLRGKKAPGTSGARKTATPRQVPVTNKVPTNNTGVSTRTKTRTKESAESRIGKLFG